MRKIILVFFIIIQIGSGNLVLAQDDNPIAKSRKENLIKQLNYRFKGGFYTFEKIFNKNVTYPEIAIANCIMGISIVSVRVDCDGEITDLKIKTPLGYGIDNEISKFFDKTVGHWNTCHDEKYTKFDIPIQFLIIGTETNHDDALLIMEAKNTGYKCNDDEYYISKMEKYMEKAKYKKAMPYIDIMIRRDPFNSYYFDLKKKAVNGGD